MRGRGSQRPQHGEETVSQDKQQLIDGLNRDLQGEFQAVIMYRLFASMVQGPYRQELRTFFANEIPEELLHAQVLADKIAALGGTPSAVPAPVTVVAEAKAMLEVALEAETATVARYVERRKQAEAAGEHGLAAEFDTLIADESKHRDELRQMLARWP
jgi:bacterioferritin